MGRTIVGSSQSLKGGAESKTIAGLGVTGFKAQSTSIVFLLVVFSARINLVLQKKKEGKI